MEEDNIFFFCHWEEDNIKDEIPLTFPCSKRIPQPPSTYSSLF